MHIPDVLLFHRQIINQFCVNILSYICYICGENCIIVTPLLSYALKIIHPLCDQVK